MWKQGLADFFSNLDQQQTGQKEHDAAIQMQIEEIVQHLVIPTMHELSEEFKRYDRKVTLSTESDRATIEIYHNNTLEMTYGLKVWKAGEDTIWISSLKGARSSRVYKATVGESIKDFVINACLSEYYEIMLNQSE